MQYRTIKVVILLKVLTLTGSKDRGARVASRQNQCAALEWVCYAAAIDL